MSTIAPLSSAPLLHNNGENTLSGGGVAVGCLIDAVGGVRQVGFATAASASLVSTAVAPAIAAIATAAASVGLLASGALSMGFTATATIPDACRSVSKAHQEFLKAKHNTLSEDAQTPQGSPETPEDPRVKSAKQLLTIRKIGVVNQCTLFAMGAIQSACGVVYMLSSQAASVFHYSTILSGSSAVLASAVTNVALGAIYLFRGSMMIHRSRLALSLVGGFRRELQNIESTDGKIKFLKTAESYGETYMDARVDSSCLKKVLSRPADNELMNDLGFSKDTDIVSVTMTANGYKLEGKENLKAYETEAQKQEYLNAIQKGIFTEQLKHKLYASVGITMIIGGILTLALTALTHGIAPIAISLGSAIFFMLAENIFFSYDTPQIFNWLRDRLHQSPKEVTSNESPENSSQKQKETSPLLATSTA